MQWDSWECKPLGHWHDHLSLAPPAPGTTQLLVSVKLTSSASSYLLFWFLCTCTPGLWLACDVIPAMLAPTSGPNPTYISEWNITQKIRKGDFIRLTHVPSTVDRDKINVRVMTYIPWKTQAREKPIFISSEGGKSMWSKLLKRENSRNFRTEFKICSEFLICVFWWDCWVRTLYQVWKQIVTKLFNEALMKVQKKFSVIRKWSLQLGMCFWCII